MIFLNTELFFFFYRNVTVRQYRLTKFWNDLYSNEQMLRGLAQLARYALWCITTRQHTDARWRLRRNLSPDSSLCRRPVTGRSIGSVWRTNKKKCIVGKTSNKSRGRWLQKKKKNKGRTGDVKLKTRGGHTRSSGNTKTTKVAFYGRVRVN